MSHSVSICLARIAGVVAPENPTLFVIRRHLVLFKDARFLFTTLMHTLFSPIEWWLQPLQLPKDQLQKRVYLLYAFLLLGPLSTYFGVTDFLAKGWNIVSIFCFSGTVLSIVLTILSRYQNREHRI